MNRSALPLVWGRYRPGPLVPDVVAPEAVAVGAAAIARTVVGQASATDPDADLGEPGDRQFDRPRGALAALVGDQDNDRVAAGIVDEHLEVVVAADTAILGGDAPSEDAPATAVSGGGACPTPVGRATFSNLASGAASDGLWAPGVGTAQGLVVVRFGEHHNMQCGGRHGPQDVVVWSWYRIPDFQ